LSERHKYLRALRQSCIQSIIVKTARAFPFLLLALILAGCKPDAALRKGEVFDKASGPKTAATATAPVPNAGIIKGTVQFNGTPPARVPIDMSMDPACAMSASQNLSEQIVVAHGKLANVFVYIKSGLPPAIAPGNAPVVVLNQKGCRYTPHVIAVQQGGTVEFRNSDPTMHNIHIVPNASGNQPVDISQGPMGAPQTHQFNTPESMLPIRCNNHPWMEAFLNVSPNAYFAVSGDDGSFTIPNLPPGTYTLAAVQEKLGERDMQITIKPSSTTKADIIFSK
jgi:plastocyanin